MSSSDEMETAKVEAIADDKEFEVYYTQPPPRNYRAGRLVDEALFHKVAPALCISDFDEHELLHDAEQAIVVSVQNARQNTPALSLQKDGFMLVNLDDTRENTRSRMTRDVACAEAVALVKTVACPDCTEAVAFDATYRNSARNNRNSTLGPGGWQSSDSAAVGRVHADFTPKSAVAKIEQLRKNDPSVSAIFDSDDITKKPSSCRLAIVNVWRPLGHRDSVVQHKPLGLLHPGSLTSKPFPYSLVYRNQAGTNASLAHDVAHKWFYFPEMTPHEALLFYNFYQDNTCGATVVAPEGTFHAALQEIGEETEAVPKGVPRAPPRESVEVRVLVRWD